MSKALQIAFLTSVMCLGWFSLAAQVSNSRGVAGSYDIGLSAKQLPKVELKDERLENLVREACQPQEHGTVLRVVLTDGHWHIKKTNAGVPERKYLGFQVATEKNGRCYLLPGSIRREYLETGKFGPETVSIIGGVRERTEMHCNNVE